MNRTRPLSRASSAALNSRASGNQAIETGVGLKRKYDESIENACQHERILIKPASISSDETQHELCPRFLISRSQLPLVYIDTNAANESQYPRMFRAVIPALEAENATPRQHILIVEDVASGTLAAIENFNSDIYCLTRLQPWVAVADFGHRDAKKPSRQSKPRPSATDEQWWTTVPLHRTSAQPAKKLEPALRARFTVIKRDPAEEKQHDLAAGSLARDQPGPPADQKIPPPVDSEATCTETTSLADSLIAIKTHYLDSLYIHRTPLAYFAKGPLSRARGDPAHSDAASRRRDLIEFLRSHIMNLHVGNKKYDNTLSELLREIPAGLSLEDVDQQVATPLKDRIRKSKKRKHISKSGLLPGEEDYILRWWVKREATLEYAGEQDTRESRIKSGLTEQRARETQLQIILILEALALETAALREDPDELTAVETADVAEAKKKKKPLDLQHILDVLIDRLCIWESMNLDVPKPSRAKPSTANKQAGSATVDAESDCLRDFCTDIIVPYYAARLPELYASICQKLSGPALASSPPALRTPAVRKVAKPGAAVSRVAHKKDAHGLDARAPPAAGLSRRQHGPLSRAATDSQLPSLKQELDEIDLSRVPRHRPTLQEARRFSQREVDLTAVTQATEAKLARKAAAEQELKKAIATLRKPNARLAVQDFVDSADLHTAAQKARPRKSKAPTRNPFATATAVQVTATPKSRRQARMPYALPPLPGSLAAAPSPMPVAAAPSVELVPPSSEPRVPASAIKSATTALIPPATHTDRLADTPLRSVTAPRAASPALDATPSRKRAKVVPARRPSMSLSAMADAAAPAADNDFLWAATRDHSRVDQPAHSSPQLPPPLQHTPRPVRSRTSTTTSSWADAAVAPAHGPSIFCTPVKAGRSQAACLPPNMQETPRPADSAQDQDLEEVALVGATPAPRPAVGTTRRAHDGAGQHAEGRSPEKQQPDGVDTAAAKAGLRPKAEAENNDDNHDDVPAAPATIYAMLGWDDDVDDLAF